MSRTVPAPTQLRTVPVEPTERMLSAAFENKPWRVSPHGEAAAIWAAMLEAAPEQADTFTIAKNAGDKRFLTWLADRLVYVYGESPNVDFVLTLRAFAAVFEHVKTEASMSATKPDPAHAPAVDMAEIERLAYAYGDTEYKRHKFSERVAAQSTLLTAIRQLSARPPTRAPAVDMAKIEGLLGNLEAEAADRNFAYRDDAHQNAFDAALTAIHQLAEDKVRAERELACRDALIKDHLGKIIHLENRVDEEQFRSRSC